MAKHMLGATLWVAALTLASRALGLLRDMLIAKLFGADWATDAFFVAFKLPNFLRRLFTEGAVSQVCLPVLTASKARGGTVAVRVLLGKAAGAVLAVSVPISAVGMVLSPLLITVLAPGFAWQGEGHDLAVRLLQICWAYLLPVSLVALAASALHAYGQFAVAASMPALLNVAMIACALWLAPRLQTPITALAWGIVLAGVLQVLALLPCLARLRLLPRLRLALHDPVITRLYRNLLPSVFSVSVIQLNVLLDSLVASFLAAGSVSWLYYSDRLVEFPQGILGMALGTVILPKLAHSHAAQDPAMFSATVDLGLRWAVLVGLPATLALWLLAGPLLWALFQYQAFSPTDAQMAAQGLRGYAVGLVGYLAIKVLVPAFAVRENFKTPVRCGWWGLWVSLALNGLAWPLAHAGLALATSLGGLVNAGLLLRQLLNTRAYRPNPGGRLFLLRVVCASLAMAAVLEASLAAQPAMCCPQPAAHRFMLLLGQVVLGAAAYAAALAITGLRLRHLRLNHY